MRGCVLARWALWGGLSLVSFQACERRVETAEVGLDMTADREALANSWIAKIASHPDELAALAKQSPGWRSFFVGNPKVALEDFEKSIASAPEDQLFDLHVGAARAALEWAKAEHALAALTADVLPKLAEKKKQNQQLIEDASPNAEGPDAKSASLDVEEARAVLPLVAPEGYAQKSLKERRKLHGMNPTSDSGSEIYASVALQHCEQALKLSGASLAAEWLAAEAEILLGRNEKALSHLELLLNDKSTAFPLSFVVISEWTDLASLRYAAALMKVLLQPQPKLAQLQAVEKPVVSGSLSKRTSTQVWLAWAVAQLGETPASDAFPEDRMLFSHIWSSVLQQLAPDGGELAGAQDVANLQLIDRLVDLWERRFAEALRKADPARAVKLRADAEEKTRAAEPSARNRWPSLAENARDNVTIGRARVALKYLSRLEEQLPAAGAPAELLRDLLTLQAMDQSSNAILGQ